MYLHPITALFVVATVCRVIDFIERCCLVLRLHTAIEIEKKLFWEMGLSGSNYYLLLYQVWTWTHACFLTFPFFYQVLWKTKASTSFVWYVRVFSTTFILRALYKATIDMTWKPPQLRWNSTSCRALHFRTQFLKSAGSCNERRAMHRRNVGKRWPCLSIRLHVQSATGATTFASEFRRFNSLDCEDFTAHQRMSARATFASVVAIERHSD